ncbi:unnamed protein product [Caenorhabditis brenneri]
MGKGKKKKRSRDIEKEEASGDNDGKAAHQRPNCCDTLMLALVCFFFVLVIAISIPLLMTAAEKMDIEFISKRLKTLKK